MFADLKSEIDHLSAKALFRQLEVKSDGIDFASNDYLGNYTFHIIKSGKVMANYIYYANYGRQEDFAYLINKISTRSIAYKR